MNIGKYYVAYTFFFLYETPNLYVTECLCHDLPGVVNCPFHWFVSARMEAVFLSPNQQR